jgi:hypothetical protein
MLRLNVSINEDAQHTFTSFREPFRRFRVDLWGFNSVGNRMIGDFVLASWAELKETKGSGERSP